MIMVIIVIIIIVGNQPFGAVAAATVPRRDNAVSLLLLALSVLLPLFPTVPR